MKQQRKRILIVTDFFYPHWTGISKSLLYLVVSLKKVNPITVLTMRYQKRLPLQETVEGAAVIRTPITLSFSRTHFSLSFLPAYLRLVPQHDTVLINSPCTYIFPAVCIAKLLRKRVVVFHQGDLNLPPGILNRFIEQIFDASTILACHMADSVSTYTKDYARHSRILSRFEKKFTPLLMPITVPVPGKRKNKTDRTLEAMKKKKYILFGFAGRFVEEKGFDILFRAIPHILEKLPHARFVFAGETRMGYEHFFDQKRRLWGKAEPFVTRLGLLNGEDLASFYRHIDFMIMPSRSDCFPLVQAEVMLAGKPVLATNIPGLRVPVRETGFGLLFRKNDPEDLANAVIAASRKKESILKNKRKAAVFFDADEHTKTVAQFFAR